MKTTNDQTTRPSTSASCVAAARILKHPVLLLLLAALTLAAALPAGAQCPGCGTAVGSVVSGETWTASGSPYCVNSDVLVVSLTIQSNVTVRFCGNYEFQVLGSLRVNGASNAPVVFTPQDAQAGWRGIVIQDAPAASFNWAIIEGSTNSGVRSVNTSVAFTNCVIRNNIAPLSGGGVSASIPNGQSLVMVGCVVSNNVAHPNDLSTGGGAGGGVWVNGWPQGMSRFVDCSISGNTTLGVFAAGGGMYLYCSQSVVQNCDIAGNRSGQAYAASGGGIYAQQNCTIKNSRIRNCSVTGNINGSGSGVEFHTSGGGALIMVNCIVTTNYGSASGAIYLVSSSDSAALIRNCIIASNAGAGVSGDFYYYGHARIENCTIIGNGGYAAHGCAWGPAFSITNSILFFNNSGFYNCTLAYCNLQGSVPSGAGNISVIPALCPQNWSLLPGSPCIDAGSPDAIYNDACIDNTVCSANSRGTTRNDMGAYGGPGNCYWLAGDAPNLVTQPTSQSSCLGQTVTFYAFATGAEPLTYQWFFNSNPMAGQTNRSLVLTNLQSANGGPYSVVASNLFGSVASGPANLVVQDACVDICQYAGLNISGLPGRTYELRCTTDLSNTNFATWTFLGTNTTPWFYIDTNSCASPKRFYGVKLLP